MQQTERPPMSPTLRLATTDDIPTIVGFLTDMLKELNEPAEDPAIMSKSIARALTENVFWFLFVDEKENVFGSCYLQSVHNYWRMERRFYLGAFYIAPSHRGQGCFRKMNALLKKWAEDHDGVEIYAHIHKNNEKSLKSFASIDLKPDEYLLCVNYWGH